LGRLEVAMEQPLEEVILKEGMDYDKQMNSAMVRQSSNEYKYKCSLCH
jgi:hypothetical protein